MWKSGVWKEPFQHSTFLHLYTLYLITPSSHHPITTGANHHEKRDNGLILRVCVIGMGPIGNLHADIYRADSLAELSGVCDRDIVRAKQAGERLGVPWFTDAAAMLDALKPEVCSIATGGYEYS